MCGIFNVVNKRGRQLDISRCHRALAVLDKRGPDLKVCLSPLPNVFLGQTVLSLVGDVSHEQVGSYLWSDSGRYCVNFNGEIYNYHELSEAYLRIKGAGGGSDTDTEVLARLHDVLPITEIPKQLDGMYAYSVYDKEQREITLCRDPQGEKSLFIYEDEEWVIISSQIDAIQMFELNLDLEEDSLKDYFYTRHFLQQERSAFRKIRQIQPGVLQTLTLDSLKWRTRHILAVHDWVSADRSAELDKRSIEDLTEELDSILDSCVREMVPQDRKVASVLSGGIDSSLLSAYACRATQPDLLVAVNHVGKDNISFDLSGFENALNKEVTILDVDVERYATSVAPSVRVLGSPLLSHSFVGQNIQSEYVHRKGCKALFGGEGADELFGGYECYINPDIDTKTCPSLYSGFFPPANPLFKHDTSRLSAELEDGWQKSMDAYSFLGSKVEQVTAAQMLADFSLQVPSVAMRGADLMSMMWSLETRSIFVRKPIVEFALNLPMRVKIDAANPNPLMVTKNILKRLFLKYFPAELLVAKQGFSGFPNESQYLLGDFQNFESLEILGISKDSLLRGDIPREQLWKLINVEHFVRSLNTVST